MKLSIIIPVYNAEKYLDECLKSIVCELPEDSELIIVDDGSKDSSSLIYGKYNQENIRIFKNENHGVSFSRNFGLTHARGDYVCFVDADDYMTKGWSEKVYNAIDNGENDLILFILSSNSNVDKNYLMSCNFQVTKSLKWVSTPWAKIYKKNLLFRNNIKFKSGVINGEDMLFNAETIIAANNIKHINENIYNYRVNIFSVTKTFNKNIFTSDQLFLSTLKDMCEKNNIDLKDFYYRCVENAIIMFLQRLSLISKNERKEYTYIFKEKPYLDYINSNTRVGGKFNKFILKMIKKGKIQFSIKIVSVKQKVRKIIKKENKEEFIIKI